MPVTSRAVPPVLIAAAVFVAGTGVAAASAARLDPAGAGAAPATHAELTCEPSELRLHAWGTGFPAGVTFDVRATRNHMEDSVTLGRFTAAPDGTWTAPVWIEPAAGGGGHEASVTVTLPDGTFLDDAHASCASPAGPAIESDPTCDPPWHEEHHTLCTDWDDLGHNPDMWWSAISPEVAG